MPGPPPENADAALKGSFCLLREAPDSQNAGRLSGKTSRSCKTLKSECLCETVGIVIVQLSCNHYASIIQPSCNAYATIMLPSGNSSTDMVLLGTRWRASTGCGWAGVSFRGSKPAHPDAAATWASSPKMGSVTGASWRLHLPSGTLQVTTVKTRQGAGKHGLG